MALDWVLRWWPRRSFSIPILSPKCQCYKSHFHSDSSLPCWWLYTFKMLWAQQRNRNITENQPWEHTTDQLAIVCSVHAVGGISLLSPVGPAGCGSCDHRGLETLAGDIIQRYSPGMEEGTPIAAERLGVRDVVKVITVKKKKTLLHAKILTFVLSLTLSF